jgi:hypothetical protein
MDFRSPLVGIELGVIYGRQVLSNLSRIETPAIGLKHQDEKTVGQ